MKPFLKILPMAFSFFAYSAHWWTDTEGSLTAAIAVLGVWLCARTDKKSAKLLA
ncbi:MAG: hypothetical protein II824_06440 [Bacteroidales bacterium]|nr:hypothetical protein [Bacteroidales bacterium]